jgi:hypothetical protein
MVLLHHHVVPGLDGGVRPRPRAIVVEAGQVPSDDRDRAQVEPVVDGSPAPTAAPEATTVTAAAAA